MSFWCVVVETNEKWIVERVGNYINFTETRTLENGELEVCGNIAFLNIFFFNWRTNINIVNYDKNVTEYTSLSIFQMIYFCA